MSRDIIIAGYSHIFALGVDKNKPLELSEIANLDGVRFWGLAPAGDRNEEYWQALVDNCAGKTVALSWFGNQHYLSYLFIRRPLFDFFLDGYSPPMEGAVLVPATVIRAGLEQSLEGLEALVRRLFEAGAVNVIVLGTPPPKGDLDEMLRRIRSSAQFSERARKMGVSLDTVDMLTPIPIIQKIWKVMQDVMLQKAEKSGATFLPVPDKTMAENGTLSREYWSVDITHANKKYGDTVKRAITDFLIASEAAQ
jgi:hypothetical protein